MDQSQIEKAKIGWRCKRGMLELDLILIPYFEAYYDVLSLAQRHQYKQLLTATDPQLYGWLLGFAAVDDKELESIVQDIKARMRIKSF